MWYEAYRRNNFRKWVCVCLKRLLVFQELSCQVQFSKLFALITVCSSIDCYLSPPPFFPWFWIIGALFWRGFGKSRRSLVRLRDILAGIRTENLANMSLKCYRYANSLSCTVWSPKPILHILQRTGRSRNSSVGIATGNGFDGRGVEFESR
jgi:hypothetical protein